MLEISLLGQATFKLNNEPRTSGFITNKAQALFIYVLMQEASCARDQLASLLWGERPQKRAQNSLRNALSHVQKQFPGYLDVSRTAVTFDRSQPYQIDIEAFETSLPQDATVKEREAQLALYRGEFLAGLVVRNALAFEEWVLVEQERLRQVYIDYLQNVVEQCLTEQAYQTGLNYVELLLALDPFRERVYEAKMTMLAYMGKRQVALQIYHQYQKMIEQEFAVAPGERLQAIYEQARSGVLSKQISSSQHTLDDPWKEAITAQVSRKLERLDASRYYLHGMPHLDLFYGREQELEALEALWRDNASRLVAIVGIGGQGKTALAAQLCQRPTALASFEYIIWQPLINAPLLEDMIKGLLQFFGLSSDSVSTNLQELAQPFFDQFRQHRCLLILDNMESVLDSSQRSYQAGYEEYGLFLQRLGQTSHQSCVVVTSREIPPEVSLLAVSTSQVRVFTLEGVSRDACQQILITAQLVISEAQVERLLRLYDGNPLALKLVADTIVDLFFGDVEAFLDGGIVVYGQIQDILARQISRLSRVEADVLMWLAIEREPTDVQTLWHNLYALGNRRDLFNALETLRNRSLLQALAPNFSLQNVIIEYLTEQLIGTIIEEITSAQPDWLQRFSLLKAQSQDYVRRSQERVILRPLTKQLIGRLGKADLIKCLQQIVADLQQQDRLVMGYTAGNILNMLIHLGVDLEGYAFSNLAIWQAYLQETPLPAVDFSGSDLTGSLFMNDLSYTSALAFNPTGEYLATAHQLAIVKLWRTDDLSEWQTFSRGNIGRGAVAFSPDDKLLAANGQEYSIYVWTYQTGETNYILTGHTSHILALAFSPDSQLLASGSYDQTVRLWDMRTGNQIATLEGHTNRVLTVDVSPDGTLVASGGLDHHVRIWSIETKQCLYIVDRHNNSTETVAFSPDGQWLASADLDGLICLWHVKTMTLDQILPSYEGPVYCVTFSPDGHYLAAKFVKHIRLYSTKDGTIVHTLFTGDDEGLDLAFHPNGKLLAVSGLLSSVHLWDIEKGVLLYDRKSSRNHECAEIIFSQDSTRVFSRNIYGELVQWHLHNKQLRPRYTPTPPLENIATIQVVNGSEIENWTYPEVSWLGGEGPKMINTYMYRMDPQRRKIAIQTFEPAIWVVDMHTKQIEHRFTGHTFLFFQLAFSPDGSMFAASYEDRTVHLWDIASETQLHTIQLTGSILFGVAFSADGRYVVCGQDDTLGVWEVATGQQTRTFDPHPAQNPSSPIIITADGTMVASIAQDHTILLWDFHTGHLIRTLEGHGSLLTYDLAFSPDDTLLASSDADDTIRVWDVATGKCLDILTVEGPYEGMNITDVIGLTASKRAELMQLGAFEQI